MPDKEKVIIGLEICTAKPPTCRGCPYYDSCKIDAQKLKEDALTLLKEQEAVSITCITQRVLVDDSNDEPVYSNDRFYDCPHCGQRLSRTYPNKDIKYCWNCGQKVKWE